MTAVHPCPQALRYVMRAGMSRTFAAAQIPEVVQPGPIGNAAGAIAS